MYRRQIVTPLGSVLVLLAGLCGQTSAQDEDAWEARKCAIYERAWARALQNVDANNVNYAFIAANENFIASGCAENVKACPRSHDELELANLLSLVMINEGAASTFLPFGCPAD